jgi:hypothetical protein
MRVPTPKPQAKNWLWTACAAGLALASLAQDYSVDWYKIVGGGGAWTGGFYTTTGTIGKADAGQANGGQFAVAGGFWGIVAVVQTTHTPPLSIARTATNTIVVWWTSPSTGWRPQQTSSLDTTNWAAPPRP